MPPLLSSTVYVIDDDEGVRNGLEALLESEGQAVQTFSKAEEFLNIYQPENKGCLLLDLNMPGMNGHDVLKELAKRNITMPVIIITSADEERTRARVIREGASCILQKPLEYNKLIETITHVSVG